MSQFLLTGEELWKLQNCTGVIGALVTSLLSPLLYGHSVFTAASRTFDSCNQIHVTRILINQYLHRADKCAFILLSPIGCP